MVEMLKTLFENRTARKLNAAALAHYYEGDFTAAEVALLDATVAAPRYASPWYNLSLVYAGTNRLIQATEAYRTAFALDPDYARATSLQVVPQYIQIETIRACNAACVMCPLETSPTPNRVMSDDTFERIVSEISGLHPLPSVAVHGLGEPLMDKKLSPVFVVCARRISRA